MRRFLTTSLIVLALLAGAAGVAPAAHASDFEQADAGNMTGPVGGSLPTTADGLTAANTQAGPNATPSAAQQAAAAASPTALASLPPMTSTYASVVSMVATLFAWLVGVAAITLDNVVYYTVVTMGSYVHNLAAVGVTWRILRDIGNILLIFGFLAAGIATIINLNIYGWGKQMLPMLLVAAVFLNFSLFISEAIIDSGNLFATQFYTQINGGNPAGTKNFDFSSIKSEGISSKIMGQIGLATIYSSALSNGNVFSATATTLVGFMSIILFLITAFVMFTLAFILVARFVILLFLIITAPVGFAGLAMPKLSNIAGQWWHMLAEQTVTAPVLFLLLYIALAIITDVHFLSFGPVSADGWTGFVTHANGTTNYAGFASLVLSFLVAMGLLVAVVYFSKKLSAFGADGAAKWGSKLSGLSIAAAAPGFAGRYTLGLGSNYAAKKLRGTAFGRSILGRGIAGTLEKRVAGASFDVRNTSLGKTVAGYGLDLGKGQKGGYKADLEARVKSYEAASAGITGGAREKEEKAAAQQAKAKVEAATRAHNQAREELNPALVQENARQKAEVEQLEKEKARFGVGTFAANEIEKQLTPAREKLAKSNEALSGANEKLKKAEEELSTATKNETVARKTVGTAKKEAQREYAERLENTWGRIPVFGTAAAIAAPRVRNNIGKTADQRAIEGLLKDIKDKAEGSEGGGTVGKKEEKEEK